MLRNKISCSVLKMGAQTSSELDVEKEVKFTVHGELHTVKGSNEIGPETSLNTYLRNNAGLRGTKGMCYEAGCGACIVAVTVKHPITKKERTFAINSCMIPILTCHGWNINTIEGIGNRKNGYHPIQQTLAKFNGTQCGICSGGMIMNMYALYESSDMLTMKDVEDAFGGNLCRCTGYRPIMDAFKSLTKDAPADLINKFPDIEDIKMCSKTGKQCQENCTLKNLVEKPICISFGDKDNWYKVYSISEILELFQNMGDSSYRFVAGNTGKGVYPMDNKPEFWIDVLSVPDLISHTVDKNLVLGGNVSLTDTMAVIMKLADETPASFWHLKQVWDHLDLVANVPVRNAGTIAGNLTLKHDHHEFPSDVFLLLETIKATVKIVERSGSVVEKSLLEFLDFDMNKCILKSIVVPPICKDTHFFQTYKICPRVQNAHAYINAGFLVEHDKKNIVKSARIVIGGINPDFVHAVNTEKYLVGKNLFDNSTLQGALEELNKEIEPDYVLPDAHPNFRKELAMSLFYKFVLASAPKEKVNVTFLSGGTRLKRDLSSGIQTYQTDKTKYPLTEPIPKLEAMMQCSGEAQYINDIPPIQNEVYAAFVLADCKPFSTIKKVDISEAMKMKGFVAYVDHKDIPGVNSFSPPALSPTVEPLFCADQVLYNGQPIGLIIANTYDEAYEAAKQVQVEYGHGKGEPRYTIEDVLKAQDMDRVKNVVKINPGKSTKAKNNIEGNVKLESQYHFTMETQICVCVPNDDGGLEMFAGTQWMDHAQISASRALNMPMNKINISVKRLGGAYGAKIIRSSQISTACAVAAMKLHRPVRLSMSLIDNMMAIGKRQPISCEYEIGYEDDGTIKSLKNTFYQSQGISGVNESSTEHIQYFIPNGYLSDFWELNGNMVQTDMPGNSYARAPGSVEAVAMTESIIDHLAFQTKKDPVDIRRLNIDPSEKVLIDMINETVKLSDYEKRKKDIEEYNSKNRWMKKGLGFAIMKYPFFIFGPFSVFVSIYAQDGTVAISHGGTECGQGINTKVAQVCARTLGISLDMVSIKPSNNLTAPNNMATGGSITSEAVCYATIKACEAILKRLEPVKEKMKDPTWQQLVLQGFVESVELCETHMFSVKSEVKGYNINGVCVTEVDVDCLTGEHNIVRVDLVEDVGQSMSPEVDVGQIEGAFVMGMGYQTCEKLIYDENGKCLTNRTWTYKIPGVKDIPTDFRVTFKPNSDNPNGVLNSKATGEPPLCLSIAVPLAIRRALYSARKDADVKREEYIPINGPTTVEYTYLNCLNDYKTFKL